MKFLTYWETTLEGKIYSVQISHAGLSEPAALRNACGFWTF